MGGTVVVHSRQLEKRWSQIYTAVTRVDAHDKRGAVAACIYGYTARSLESTPTCMVTLQDLMGTEVCSCG